MTGNEIELVCFDVGNVLIELSRGWPEACAAARVSLPPALTNQAVILELTDLNRQHERGHIDARAFDTKAAACTGLSTCDVAAVSRAWLRQPFPGVTDLLQEVAATSTTTACLSNTNDRHWSMFHGVTPNRCELPTHFLDHCIASHLIGAMKPDDRAFHRVEQTTAVSASRILFFDDAVEHCTAAGRRGWHTCRADPRGNPAAQMRERLVEEGVL